MPDSVLTRDGPVLVPMDYVVPQGGELAPVTVRATVDGTAAAAAFYAVVEVIAPSGRVMAIARSDSIAAGASADVTWFPGVKQAAASTSSALEVTDGTNVVSNVTEVLFQAGASVSSGGAGIADVTIPSTPSGSIGGFGVYGDSSDGTVTFDGSATVLGLVPTASVYTLNRDVLLASCTISNGVTIITNGFRIFVHDTLTNNGTIQWNGQNATSPTAGGLELSNISSSFNTGTGSNAPGSGGGQGNTGIGSVGVSQSGTQRASYGGAGGTGGTGVSAGGTGGVPSPRSTIVGTMRNLVPAVSLQFVATGNFGSGPFGLMGGAGGGGGGGDGTNRGGHGGGGGGVVGIFARLIAGIGSFSASGGSGATASVGNCGGGGGGGGGVVVVVSGSAVGSAIAGQTISVQGGAKGSPSGTGTDNATAGANGTAIVIPN